MAVYLMIVLPSLSQEKYSINDSSYYCYPIEDNKIIALLLNDRISYKGLYDNEVNKNVLLNYIIKSNEELIAEQLDNIDSLKYKFDMQLEQNIELREDLENSNKWKVIYKIGVTTSIIINIILLIAV